MVDLSGLVRSLSEKFAVSGVRYALIGGFALHAAGYVRATSDIDLLVNADDAGILKNILTGIGYKLVHEDENVLHFDTQLQLVGGVDVVLARRKYTLAMLEKSHRSPQGVPVVRPEDIIGLKVQAIANDRSRRHRDLADIAWLLSAHRSTMDMTLIREYFTLFNMGDELENLLPEEKNA